MTGRARATGIPPTSVRGDLGAPVLNVDLDLFAVNIAAVRRRVAPAELMLVVKDDAYGHGLLPVVRRARSEGVSWFGAFDVASALAVRDETGAASRIFVWLVVGDREAELAVRADLDIGIGDAALLEDVADAARSTGTRPRVHLKIDTGLRRNGVRPEDWPSFVRRAAELQSRGELRVVGVWSHIAEASDADDDDARARFDSAVRLAREEGIDPEVRHLAASAAAAARPEFRYDLVRVGAYCYGIRPAGGPAEADLGIRPIAALTAPVLSTGERVIAGIGALHGIPSALASRTEVGTPVGRAMLVAVHDDSIEVAGWAEALPGDVITVYGGGGPSATDLAEAIGTIGEEIVLRVSPLVERRYAGDADAPGSEGIQGRRRS